MNDNDKSRHISKIHTSNIIWTHYNPKTNIIWDKWSIKDLDPCMY